MPVIEFHSPRTVDVERPAYKEGVKKPKDFFLVHVALPSFSGQQRRVRENRHFLANRV